MNFEVTRVFDRNWKILEGKKHPYIINSGGSRSSKTYSILQIFAILLIRKKNYRISCYRNLRVDSIETMGKDFEDIVNSDPQMQIEFVHNKKDATWTNKTSGSQIIFAGTEKVHKALGQKNDIIFLNEISEFSEDVFNQLDQRTRDFVFVDYNPSKEFWIEKYRNNEKAIFIHSTYKDNPFLTEKIINKLESYNPFAVGSTEVIDGKVCFNEKPVTLKNQPPGNRINIAAGTANRYLYEVYCLGLGSEKPNRIYTGWKKCSLKYYNSLEFENYYGLDFGISKPTAMLGAKYDGDRTFYINESLYMPSSQMGMSIADYLIKKLKVDLEKMIVADSAKHTMVQDLRDSGLYAIDALKGAGSIQRGLTQIQGFNIVYTETSKNIKREYDDYSYKIDRYGLVTDEIDQRSEDHLMDALRYIISYLIKYLGIYSN